MTDMTPIRRLPSSKDEAGDAPTGCVLYVGAYRLTQMHQQPDSVFLQHASGEGMQMKASALFELLDKYFFENF